MALIQDTYLTDKGFEIANKAANGQTSFEITKVVSSDQNINSKTKDEIKKLNNLSNEINSGQIINTDIKSNNLTGIVTQFGNDIYTSGYEVGAIALYAKENNSDNEFLYSVTPMVENQKIPEVNTNVFLGFQVTIYVVAGDSQRMNVNLSKGGDASIDLVEKLISNSEDEIRNKINNDISPRLDSLNTSKVDKSEVDNKITDLKNKYHNDGEIKNGYNLNNYTWNGEFLLFDVDINTLEGNDGLPKNSYPHFYGILKVEQMSEFPRQTLTDNIGNKWYKYAGNGATWQQIAYQSYVDDKVKDSFNSANSYTDSKTNQLSNHLGGNISLPVETGFNDGWNGITAFYNTDSHKITLCGFMEATNGNAAIQIDCLDIKKYFQSDIKISASFFQGIYSLRGYPQNIVDDHFIKFNFSYATKQSFDGVTITVDPK